MDTQKEFNIKLLRSGQMICRNSQFCKGKQIGIHKRMFGAELLEEIDSVCAVFAAEVCDTPWIVTKTINCEFVSEILENQIYKTYVGIKRIGNTSITISAEIRKHSVDTEKEILALKCETIFVRINEYGEPIKISDNVRNKYPELSE